MFGAWMISLIALTVLAGVIGNLSKANHFMAILIDKRNRYSLNQFQLVGWTLLILAAFVAVFIESFPKATIPIIPNTLLALMGISVGTSAFASGIKANKDAATAASPSLAKVVSAAAPKFIQLTLEEEGKAAEDERISVSKFQALVFTLVLWVIFVILFLKTDPATLPTLPESAVWLIGISHSGYIAAKVPTQA